METEQLEKYRMFIRKGKTFNDEMSHVNSSLYYAAEYVAKTKCDAAVAVAEVTQGIDFLLSSTSNIFAANTQYLQWNIAVFNRMACDVYIAQEEQLDNSNPLLISCNFGSLPKNAAYRPNPQVYETLNEVLGSIASIYNQARNDVYEYTVAYRQTMDCVPPNIQEEMNRFFLQLNSFFFDESFEGGASFTGATNYVHTIIEDWMQRIRDILDTPPDVPTRVRKL